MLTLPIQAPSGRLLARNAVRLALSSDPFAIAEHLGLEVYAATPEACGGSPAIVVGNSILVCDLAAPAPAVARAVALVLIDRWRVSTTDAVGLARSFAIELGRLEPATVAA